MDLLRFSTAGSVDDGKSTLIGRLLYDNKTIFEDQLESVERIVPDAGIALAREALSGELRTPPITLSHRRPGDPGLAWNLRRNRPTLAVEHIDTNPRNGSPDGHRPRSVEGRHLVSTRCASSSVTPRHYGTVALAHERSSPLARSWR